MGSPRKQNSSALLTFTASCWAASAVLQWKANKTYTGLLPVLDTAWHLCLHARSRCCKTSTHSHIQGSCHQLTPPQHCCLRHPLAHLKNKRQLPSLLPNFCHYLKSICWVWDGVLHHVNHWCRVASLFFYFFWHLPGAVTFPGLSLNHHNYEESIAKVVQLTVGPRSPVHFLESLPASLFASHMTSHLRSLLI